jgi:hypothetical protein
LQSSSLLFSAEITDMTGEEEVAPAPQSRKRPHSEVEKEDSTPAHSPKSKETHHHVVSSDSEPNEVTSSPVAAAEPPEKETPQRYARLFKKPAYYSHNLRYFQIR